MEKLKSKLEMPLAHNRYPFMTLNEIAGTLDLTRERVRQIEARALAKLKKRLREEGIHPRDLFNN